VRAIDTHTHLPGHTLGTSPRPIAEIRAEFEADGLIGAWLMTIDGLVRDPRGHNDLLALTVEAHRDFFVPFATVNPHDGARAAIHELERCAGELRMRGLKLHPWLQAFSMTNPAVIPIFEAAAALGLPVLVHDGTPPYCTPLQIAWVAERVPEATVILGHSGLEDMYQDSILACRRNENVWLCCCSLSSGHIAQVLRQCPRERLLFGSDGGLAPGMIAPALVKLQAATDDEALREQVLWGNAERLLPIG
jgi:uncharacterized protein